MVRALYGALTGVLLAVATLLPAQADNKATAIALTEKAIKHYNKVGKEKALADFSDKANTEWVNGEFYVIVANAENGTFLAHPINPKLINTPTIWDLKDVNNTFIIRDMVESGKKSPDGGWTKYVWTHPETKKLANKLTYVKAHDKLLFMVGYYE